VSRGIAPLDNNARDFFVVTCEHGGNWIPVAHAGLFRSWQRVLATHRGYDLGAIAMARDLAGALQAPLVVSTVSRLVIDLNRSLSNPHVWSTATAALPDAARQRIIDRHYLPYRRRVEALVDGAIRAGRRVIHLSSHSFTPKLHGKVRTADVGLLYDPARRGEVALAARWKSAFAERNPGLRVRRNYPYAGKNDGFTAALRRRYPPTRYIGMEIELNQAITAGAPLAYRRLRADVLATLAVALR
jgi:predicted N-formylglutamate amidohydrolase